VVFESRVLRGTVKRLGKKRYDMTLCQIDQKKKEKERNRGTKFVAWVALAAHGSPKHVKPKKRRVQRSGREKRKRHLKGTFRNFNVTINQIKLHTTGKSITRWIGRKDISKQREGARRATKRERESEGRVQM